MRRTLIVALAIATLLCTAVFISGASERHGRGDDNDAERARIGLQISPVPLNLKHKDVHLVGLGSYIINAQASCNDCHSCPSYASGGNPYAGQPTLINAANYLAGGVPFGPFISDNLTPDANGKPAGLTAHQFRHLMRTGEDPDAPGQLLQVMPWPILKNMTDEDLSAIYEYLRSLPPAQPGTCSGAGEPAP
jgi:hypothetical protein